MKLSKDELEALLLCVDDSCATYCDYYIDCRQDCLVRSLRGKAELELENERGSGNADDSDDVQNAVIGRLIRKPMGNLHLADVNLENYVTELQLDYENNQKISKMALSSDSSHDADVRNEVYADVIRRLQHIKEMENGNNNTDNN